MASFSIDEFVGNGVLKGLLPKLLEEGWDDVPTLKIMTSEDMDAYTQILLYLYFFEKTIPSEDHCH